MAASYINALLPAPFDTGGAGIKEWRWNNTVGSGATGRGTAVEISYRFLTEAPAHAGSGKGSDAYRFSPLTAAQQDAARDILDGYQAVSKITFVEGGADADLLFGRNENSPVGYAYFPELLPAVGVHGNDGGDVWISRLSPANLEVAPGEEGWQTLLHEIGHALGLKHPGNYGGDEGPFLPSSTRSHQYTVMAYEYHKYSLYRYVEDGVPQYKFITPSTPMLYDIAAIQYLYGKNTTTGAGNTTYTFDPAEPFFKCIWDYSGAADTIDVSNFDRGCKIDLNEGKFSSIRIPSEPMPDGYLPDDTVVYNGTNNLSIAFGARIERAEGGSGHDQLIGNKYANWLSGNSGNDTLDGGSGNDRMDGDAGTDTLEGGAGNDTLIGGSSGDRLIGGSGNDLFYLEQSSDRLVDSSGIDTVRSSLASYTLADAFEKLRLAGAALKGTGNDLDNTIEGNELDNTLKGGAGTDSLSGGDGMDTLDGGSGNDTMNGGAHDDTFIVNAASDKVIEADEGGIDTVRSSVSETLSGFVENLVLTGVDISGTGNDEDNTITGSAGKNRLNGVAGNDTLFGDAGNDTLDGGIGNDSLDGGAAADRLLGGEGDDLLVWDIGDALVDGGAGMDTLQNAGGDIDLTDVSDTKLVSIERVDLSGGLAGALTLTESDVLAMSPDTDTLTVLGDEVDSINAIGFVAEGEAPEGFVSYMSIGGAILLVEAGVAVNLS